MKEYRFSIRGKNYDTFTEYHKTLNECKNALKKELNGISYMFIDDSENIMIDTLEDNIIIDTKILRGKEFIIS